MQTRRALAQAALDNAALKPTLSTVFKSSKARTSSRTTVAKTTATSVRTRVSKPLVTLIESDGIDTALVSSQTTKTRRGRKDASPPSEPMEIDSTKTAANTNATIAAVATAKDSKPNVPEVDPWTKRPKHIPSYAEEALAHLCKADPALAPLIAKYPYSIYSDHDTNYFRVLTRTILGQQIHWKAARSIIYKFVSYYFPDQVTLESLDAGDKRFPSPEQVLATSMDILRQRGLSERKASYVQDLARHFAEGKITFTDKAALQSMTDEEVASQLLCVRGIGPWTVDMFMMDSLERLDVLPTLDLGIRRGMEKHFRKDYKNGVWGSITEEVEITEADMDTRGSSSQVITKVVTKKKSGARGKGKAKNGEMTCEDMERMAERWRPYRTIASWYMWRNADDEEAIKAPII